MTAEEAREMIEYNPATGLFRWRVRLSNRQNKGWFAGSVNDRGYLRVRMKGVCYRAHRLAWFLYYGEWPENNIDHINGDTKDNRIENLRDVTQQENLFNRRGVKGYTPSGNKYAAYIGLGGNHIYIGTFDTAEEARAAYLKKKEELHVIGAEA